MSTGEQKEDSRVLHIASLIVQHRDHAMESLDACIATLPGVELALRQGGRSIVLCEGDDESSVLRCIDTLNALDGVIGISLVHHHAEDANSLMEEMEP